ncbi:MAG: hypothetical protein NVS1B4_02600 [Gemmatimonadaceae bacterium]
MITTLVVKGMKTVHCVRAVYTGLTDVPGIAHAEVTRGKVVVEHDGRATAELLSAAVARAGYEVAQVVEERRRLPVV